MEFYRLEDANAFVNSEYTISNCKKNVLKRKRTEQGFLITVKCDPLVEDEAILKQMDPFVQEVFNVTHATYDFDRSVKDGRRLFRVKLSVKLEEVPHFIEIDGIRTALHFAGKSFYCKMCGNTHSPQTRCMMPPKENEHTQQIAEIQKVVAEARIQLEHNEEQMEATVHEPENRKENDNATPKNESKIPIPVTSAAPIDKAKPKPLSQQQLEEIIEQMKSSHSEQLLTLAYAANTFQQNRNEKERDEFTTVKSKKKIREDKRDKDATPYETENTDKMTNKPSGPSQTPMKKDPKRINTS